MTKFVTIGVILGITVAMIIYDIVIAIEPTPGDTISKVTLTHFRAFPFSPWALGVVFMGHISWPMYYTGNYLWYSLPCLVVLTILMFMLSWFHLLPVWLDPVVYCLIGFPCGHWLWPQY